MGRREAGDPVAGESNPILRGDRDNREGGMVEIKPYRGLYVRSFSRSETADLDELFKLLECFAVELSRIANEQPRY
jgi:hypothetical protein